MVEFLVSNKKKIILICLCILMIILMKIYVSIKYHEGISSPPVDAKIVGYDKSTTYAPDCIESNMRLFNMDEGAALDMKNNPGNYCEYWLKVYIKNINKNTIHNLEVARLPETTDNVWLCITGFADWSIDVNPGGRFYGDITIIIKTENMSEEDIDKEIKGLILELSYSNYSSDLFRRVQNIRFDF